MQKAQKLLYNVLEKLKTKPKLTKTLRTNPKLPKPSPKPLEGQIPSAQKPSLMC